MLTARDLDFSYPQSQPVIDRLSAEFRSGRVVCVQAPSGRGKTTLLALIGGLLTPDGGSIEFDGQTMAARDLRAMSTWVLQSQNVLPARSAASNVALGGLREATSWGDALAAAHSLLDMFGLGHRGQTPAARLSGGERQRVCVARALHRNVPLILADEPTANLDRESTKQVVAALRSAARQQRIVVVASHDPDVGAEADDILSPW